MTTKKTDINTIYINLFFWLYIYNYKIILIKNILCGKTDYIELFFINEVI